MQQSEGDPERLYLNEVPRKDEAENFSSQTDIPKCRLHFKLRKRFADKAAIERKAPLLNKKLCRGKPLIIKKKRASRVVRFAESNKIFAIERSFSSDEQKRNIWYQPSDYAEIDREILKSLKALEAVNGDILNLNQDDYSLRGLEQRTSKHIAHLRRLRVCISVRAVLDQQQVQRKIGASDPETIGDVSRRFSESARTRARELGAFDSIDCHKRRR